jgi:hypothetical protein
LGVVALSASAIGGCGSDSKSSAGSSKRLDQLTTDERKAICDSVSAMLGGYGASKDCGGGLTLDAPTDQAECLAEYTYTNCPVTVAQAEKCVSEQSCTTLIPASCQGLFACQ